jgi:hypothetical protein
LDRNAAVEADSVGQFHDAAGRLHRFLGETAAAQHPIADLHPFGVDTAAQSRRRPRHRG